MLGCQLLELLELLELLGLQQELRLHSLEVRGVGVRCTHGPNFHGLALA